MRNVQVAQVMDRDPVKTKEPTHFLRIGNMHAMLGLRVRHFDFNTYG
jgi:hypothetical protein